MAGLDPAIHLLERLLRRWMDARVKPAHDAEDVAASLPDFRSTISNSQASVFSRRNASEVCPYPSRHCEGDGAAGGARGVRYAPLGGGINEPTSRGDYEPRAPFGKGAAPPGAPPSATSLVGHPGAPRSGQLSLCPLQGSLSGKRPLIEQDGSMIRPVQDPGIRNRKNLFACIYRYLAQRSCRGVAC